MAPAADRYAQIYRLIKATELVSNTSSLFMSEDAGLTWRAIFPPGGPWCNADTGNGVRWMVGQAGCR